MNVPTNSALLSDLDDCTRVDLQKILIAKGLAVSEVKTTSRMLTSVIEDRPDIVFLNDTVLPVGTLEVLPLLRLLTRALIVVIGPGEETNVANSLLQGADSYIKTPLRKREFVARLDALLRRYRYGHPDCFVQGQRDSFTLNDKLFDVQEGPGKDLTGRNGNSRLTKTIRSSDHYGNAGVLRNGVGDGHSHVTKSWIYIVEPKRGD